MLIKNDIHLVITAQDKASGVISKLSGTLSKLAVGYGAFQIGKTAIESAVKFEKSMSNINTLLNDDATIKKFGDGIKEIAVKTSVPMQDLADSLYNVVSAGIDTADALRVINKSSELAVAGLGSMEEAVDLSTSAINAFKFSGDEVDEVYATLFSTV